MLCECGKELKKITKKHIDSDYHQNYLMNMKIVNDDNELKELLDDTISKGVSLDDLKPEVREKIMNSKKIKKYKSDDFLFQSDLNENKLDIRGNYIIPKNKRPKFKKLPTRLIVVFYERKTKNSYTISDYDKTPIIVIDERIYFLDKMAYVNEGIPVYFIVYNTTCSIDMKFNWKNDKIIIKEGLLDPSVVKNYVNSIAVKYIYDDKENKLKYTWWHFFINVFSTLFFVVLAVVITYSVVKGGL